MDDPNSLVQMSSVGPPNKHLFNHYKVITIDHNFVSGTGSHKNFPVLISILDSDLHDDVQSNGNDIAFANDTAWLDHEIELFDQAYNGTHAQLVAWVRIPSLSTSVDTVIHMYYGNATMESQENVYSVWNSNYMGVWHLDEDPSELSPQFNDSTLNSNDGTSGGSMSSSDQVSGKINGGIEFDGNDDYIRFPDPVNSNLMTVSAWIYPTRLDQGWHTIAQRNNIDDSWYDWQIYARASDAPNPNRAVFRIDFAGDSTYTEQAQSDIVLSINTWYYIVGTYDKNQIRFFRDGASTGTYSDTRNIPDSNKDIWLARNSIWNEPFQGIIDEFRILNIPKSSDWIKTEYDNQFDPSSFYSIGKEYSVSNHPPDAQHFTYYKEIIIDRTMVSGPDDLLNFPVLLSNFDEHLHDNVQADGDDIAFSYSISWLDHEIELFDQAYNSTHAQLVAWVRIPSLSTSVDTVIRMYYGNSTMVNRENPSGVWIDYKGVWHFAESSGDAKDSTLYDVNGTTTDINYQEEGNIGYCFNWTDGQSSQVNYGNPVDNHLDFGTGNLTMSLWVNLDQDVDNFQWIISKGRRWSGDPGYGILSDITPTSRWRFNIGDNSGVFQTAGDTIIDTDEWHYVVGKIDRFSDLMYVYQDAGNAEDSQDISLMGSIDSDIDLVQPFNPSSYGFDGLLDEFRLTDICRSEGWINTEYNNQYDPTSFYSISKEYTMSGNPPNQEYFTYYKEIIIDHSMVSGSEDLINFPFLISTFDEDLANKAQEDGDDIAFAYHGAWLDHEIELYTQTYNSSHAQLVAWVSIPRLSTSENTIIGMYYGNSTMGSRENPAAVWSDNYLGVWHLSESSGSAEDSTSYGVNGIPSGTVTQGASGQMGNSYYFDRDGIGTVNMGNPTDGHLDFIDNEDFTIELWLDLEYFYYYSPYLVSKRAGGSSSNQGYGVQVTDDENGIPMYEISSNGPEFGVDGTTSLLNTGWCHIVYIFDEDSATGSTIYIDGVDDKSSIFGTIGSIDEFDNSVNFRLNGQSSPSKDYMIDGKMDEIRISNVARSADWIRTEFDNQNDPTSFFTIGLEEKDDITPPTYSNLIESSDPLELGETETITINVSDPSGINLVQIEFMGSNHSMNNTSGDTWQYDSWTPSSVDNYTYTIWMQDNYNNWNSTIDTIEVIDTTSPTYSDLIESADPLQVGQNETISIKVYDLSGVNQVLLEYNSSNHTMSFIGGNTWSWNKWNASLGNHSYIIFMQDMENNWNMTSGMITVVSTTAPVIENLTESEDPLELGNNITITVDVDDNESVVEVVFIELDGVNHTMTNISGITYEYNWTGSYIGLIYYTIYANDTENNWNSLTSSFDIVDTTPPAFSDLFKSEDPLELGNTVTISVNSTDLSDISQLLIEFEGANDTMTNVTGDIWQYDSWTPDVTGNWSYTIWAKDNNNNWGFISDSIIVQDTTPPIYSDLTESASVVELGDTLIISINSTDLADIKDVSLEFENLNHTMTNIGGDIWQYNSWMPISIGNYTYKIYITDNNDNLNYVSSSILFQDTIIPIHSNLFENADPLELGDNQIIRIDIYDFAGINQSLLEFEGANHSMTHSMTNIYGETWQFDSWTPNNWIVYQYTIHMKDNSGNWNNLTGNITVQDSTPPPSPVLTNSPSGDVSGFLVFDWSDGSDPSGISYYILIIDNEPNPFATPGYVHIFNITNVGSNSSYCVLPEILSLGEYYYFLLQVDGVGHQSTYTMGTFNVIALSNGSPIDNNLLIYIIIGIVIASVGGLIATATIVRKRTKKEILPQRKKIPLKEISTHINKLSGSQPFPQTQEFVGIPGDSTEILMEENNLEIKIDEYKHLGEELFEEGAYLEAQRQFNLASDLLLKLGKNEEANLLSELISGIDGLIEERERRLELLEQVKITGDSVKIYENFYDLIEISKKLRDPDAVSMYKSELIQFFQMNKFKISDLEKHRSYLEQKAESLLNNDQLKMAAQVYETCENISQLFVQLDMDDEIANIEKFKSKKTECLKRISQ
ncbi:MAG: DUF2341 domain-containing protein [Promethearchaeota archaeon]|jgi:hypothetical protein